MKTFLELYDELKEKGKGLYYNINKKRKEGRAMRKKGEKGAPKTSDFERAAQTAKEQLYDRIGPTAKLMKPILVKPKPLGTPPKLGGQTKRGYKVVARPPKLPEGPEFDKAKEKHTSELQALRDRHKREKQDAKVKDIKNEEAPSLAVLKKKIKSGTKLGSTETSSAKARGLIPRADGTKRKSPKYK